MTDPTISPDMKPRNDSPEGFDLKRIFISRQRELDLFDLYLQRWRVLVRQSKQEQFLPTMAPSPQQKLEGLLVLLYGHGGYGKSALLSRYRNAAIQAQRQPRAASLTISEIVDWEFAIGEYRGLFHPTRPQEPDAAPYFQMLCRRLAAALNKQPGDFKHYQQAIKDVEEARNQTQRALDELKTGKGHEALGSISGEVVMQLIRLVAPRVGQVLDATHLDEQIKAIAGAGTQLGADHLQHVYERLHTKLGAKLDDSLNPTLRLGLALGRDLRDFARKVPILLFFDTYEVIAEGDRLLRLVMAASGLRVGWVLAGRDDLWADYRRSIGVVYGYQDLIHTDRGLPVDFSARGTGAFSISDI